MTLGAGTRMAKVGSDTSHPKLEDASSPQKSAAPDWVQLSTGAAPKRDRLEVFRETFSQVLYRAEVENRSEGAFEGEIEVLRAGSVRILRTFVCPSTYARTRRHISDSDD